MSAMEQRLKRYFEEGDVVFQDGDTGHTMFIILEGEVEIAKVLGDRKTLLATLGPGSMFGEMALIDNQPRSAMAAVKSKAVLLEISREMLRNRMEEVPKWLRAFYSIIVERLRDATKNQSILLTQGAGRQVVNILALKAKETEPDTHDRIMIEWDKAVSETAFLLGFNEEKINDTVNVLVTSGLGKSDRREELGRVFVIEDAERFFKFASFCRERYMLEAGGAKTMSEQFAFADSREPELLQAIESILTAEGAAQDFPAETLDKSLQEKFKQPLDKYKSLMESYSKEGILDTFRPEGSEPVLRINNRELFDGKMAKMRLVVEFEELEKSIMA